jgi:beta-N-acetylhexosaminidase
LKQEINRLPAMTAGKTKIEPLVSIDQEGGLVQSLRGGQWGTISSAREQGTWSVTKLAQVSGDWAKDLARAGVTMDLAPVADTVPSGTERFNAPIGKYGREYGTDSTKVAADITTVTAAIKSAGVIATVKHFPGLGRVTGNTDTTREVTDNKTTANDPYLQSFQAGIDAGAGAVMISSAIYTQIDPGSQAVFSSKVITGLLRGQMGYQGVVITDDVGQAKAVSNVSPGNRAVRFIEAGGDLVLTVRPDLARAMMTAVSSKAGQDKDFHAQVEASVTRVLTLKQEAGLLTCP